MPEAITNTPPATPEEIERFVADCLHEFRTPLTAIHGFASLVRDGLGGPVTDRQEDYLGKTLQAVRALEHQFEEFRAAVGLRLEATPGALESCNLDDIVAEALLAMPTDASRIVCTLVEGAPRAWGNFDELVQALVGVLRFALKRSDKDDVQVDAEVVDGRSAIVVHCGGQPPTDSDCELITQGESVAGGMVKSVTRVFGIGLELARNLLARNGGRLQLRAGQNGTTLLRMELDHLTANGGLKI